MNTLAWLFLVCSGVLAVANWVSRATDNRRLEYVTKPAVMVALVLVALSIDGADHAVRVWFVVALLFSLAGDVFLMLPADRFVAGLASFLLAHLAYLAGLLAKGQDGQWWLSGFVLVVLAALFVGATIVRRAAAKDRRLGGPVALYLLVISAMVCAAAGTRNVWADLGARSFLVSDATLGWDRFVRPLRWASVGVMVTYHLAQAGLVVSLVP